MSTRTSENDMIRVITYYIYIIYIIYIVNNADYTIIPREKPFDLFWGKQGLHIIF